MAAPSYNPLLTLVESEPRPNPDASVQVLLAEDYSLVRHGLRALLEQEGIEVTGEAVDGREAVRLARELRPNVAVLDMYMPSLNGLEASKEIPKVSPKTKIILLTRSADERSILAALQSGVSGYLLKTVAPSLLVQAIKEVSRGGTCLCPVACKIVTDAYVNKREAAPDPLTAREREILQLVAEGKTTKEMAGVLGISVKTAESHRTRITEKLQIRNTAGLVRYAIRRGIIEP